MGGDRAKKLVLVVEDEPVLRASMVRALTRLGVEVVDAATQHDGLELLRACSPDLVVTDLDLADGSAVPVIARAQAPVIVISAFLNEFHDELRRFRTIRVHAKPLPIPSLVAEVTELLGVARPRRTPFSATDYIQLACMSQHSVVIEMHASWM